MIKNTLILACGCLIGALLVQYKQVIFKEVPAPIAQLPDGGQYEGELRQDLFYGHGRVSWPNGTYYEGEFRGGLYHGQGVYEAPHMTYEGEFINGQATGFGKITYPNGDVYKGDVKNWMPDGKGIYSSDRYRYNGHFKLGQFEGFGSIIYSDESRYQGHFEAGVYNGQGSFITTRGEKYSGTFKDGELEGKGEYYFESARYHGYFKDWQFDGEGTYTDADGDISMSGVFEKGVLTGLGESRTFLGLYQGEFKSGQPHGKGVLTSPNGDVYTGEFLYGLYHGNGEMVYATPLDGVERVLGRWETGLLVEVVEGDINVSQPKDVVEQALYRQRELLDEQIKQLLPNDPNKKDMYFLGVAGDGTQGVFRREVEFAKAYFDEHFQTKGRSLLLVNSRKIFDDYPLATLFSIEQTLKAISQKMDVENDILFLYLTSHGSPDHEFSLSQHAISLNNLPAKKLGEILNALPVKWKVVVVSACYSGGFIPEIKDKNTLVIASSAKDRTSFGCNDRAKMTYFGQAFFKEALPQAESFEEAFAIAQKAIEEREELEGYKQSNPKIHKPKAILEQLSLWRKGLKQ